MINIASEFIKFDCDLNYLLDTLLNSELCYNGLKNLIYVVFKHDYPKELYIYKDYMANIYTDKKNRLIPYAHYLSLHGYEYDISDKVKIDINDIISISKLEY